jgi:hypothetical protein
MVCLLGGGRMVAGGDRRALVDPEPTFMSPTERPVRNP